MANEEILVIFLSLVSLEIVPRETCNFRTPLFA